MFSNISTIGVPIVLTISIGYGYYVISGMWNRSYYDAYPFDGVLHSAAGVLAFICFRTIKWEEGFNPSFLLAIAVGLPPLLLGLWHLVGYNLSRKRTMKMQVAKILHVVLLLHLVFFGMLIIVRS